MGNPIYFVQINPVLRSTGASLVGSWAYRSGSSLIDERTGRSHNHSYRSDVVYSTLIADPTPSDIKPEAIYNQLEAAELRQDSILGRDLQVALPAFRYFRDESRLKRSHVYSTQAYGMCLAQRYDTIVGLAIHYPAKRDNPHAHFLLPDRRYIDGRPTSKIRELGNPVYSRFEIEDLRELWAQILNDELDELGSPHRVDHRSYLRQGNDLLPTIHIGKGAAHKGKAAEKLNAILTEHNDLQHLILGYQSEIDEREKEIEKRKRMRESERLEKLQSSPKNQPPKTHILCPDTTSNRKNPPIKIEEAASPEKDRRSGPDMNI